MQTFVMLTRLTRGDLRHSAQSLEAQVAHWVEKECPGVEWLHSYATLGPYDYMDLFRADDCEVAMRVATIVRSIAHAETETWPLLEWARFKQIALDLSA